MAIEKSLSEATGMRVEDIVDLAKCRNQQYSDMLMKAAKDPNSFQSRVWLFLEHPKSSYSAMFWRIVLIILIFGSVFMMFSQSFPSLSSFGESSYACENVVELYCNGKNNNTLDPACFVLSGRGKPSRQPLSFHCNGPMCYGGRNNFGSWNASLTCQSYIEPFQPSYDLAVKYGSPYQFTYRETMQRISPICNRLECK